MARRLLTLDGAPRTPVEKQKEMDGPNKAARAALGQIRATLDQRSNRPAPTTVQVVTLEDLFDEETDRATLRQRDDARAALRALRRTNTSAGRAVPDRMASREQRSKPQPTVFEALSYLAQHGTAGNYSVSVARDMVARGALVSARQHSYAKSICLHVQNRVLLAHAYDMTRFNQQDFVPPARVSPEDLPVQRVRFTAHLTSHIVNDYHLTFPYYLSKASGGRKTIVQSMTLPDSRGTVVGNVGESVIVECPVGWLRGMRGLNADQIVGHEIIT
jgi:hypothetical protein